MEKCKIFFEHLAEAGFIEDAQEVYMDFRYRMRLLPQVMQEHHIPISSWAPIFENIVGRAYQLSAVKDSASVEKDFWIEPWRQQSESLLSFADERPTFQERPTYLTLTHDTLHNSSHNVERLLGSLFERLFAMQATDLHIDSLEDRVVLHCRIHGNLKPFAVIPSFLGESLCNRIKLAAGLSLEQRQGAQDGRFSYKTSQSKVYDIRLGVMPTLHGESLSLRFLPQFALFKDLADLGFSQKEADFLTEIQEGGLYLITGPAGSGKTTTLYTILETLQRKETRSIYTVEDPVERLCLGLVQIPVNERKHVGFAEVLRGILRMDPDVLMVGELRDEQTVALAARAALTGHAVFATLHCRDAFDSIERLRDLALSDTLIASTLQYVVAQQLQKNDNGQSLSYEVWTLCDQARESIRKGQSAVSIRKKVSEKEG